MSTHNSQQEQAVITSTVWVTLFVKKLKNIRIKYVKGYSFITYPRLGPLATNQGKIPPTIPQNAVTTMIGIALAPISTRKHDRQSLALVLRAPETLRQGQCHMRSCDSKYRYYTFRLFTSSPIFRLESSHLLRTAKCPLKKDSFIISSSHPVNKLL